MSMTRIRAYFSIVGFAGSPSDLTKVVGIRADQIRSDKPDGFSWEILGTISSLSIEDHISALIERIRPATAGLVDLNKQVDVEKNIWIVIDRWDDTSRPHLYLKSCASGFLAENGISLVIDWT